ncbi:MAG TPA: hypothetical protein VEF76_10145 [Patescibacteria group bacterium]|nr:hypothetical protein [Patescibacteria group bacterium]
MKNGMIVLLAAAAIVLLFQGRAETQMPTSAPGRFAMYISDRNGRNYLLDTQTGETWTMVEMMRKNRFIAVWKPNHRVNNFEEEDRLFNNSANSLAIIQPVPAR